MNCHTTIHIKNMVCRRCIIIVNQIFQKHGFEPSSIELGTVILAQPLPKETAGIIRKELTDCGFEWIDDKRTRIIEQVRTAVIQYVHHDDLPEQQNLSDYISRQCHRDYSSLSKLFTETNGITIEKYYIAQKIERVKELLVHDELSISEIADKLHYSSSAHLSSQFRSVTGLSPTQFKQLKHPKLKPLDEV